MQGIRIKIKRLALVLFAVIFISLLTWLIYQSFKREILEIGSKTPFLKYYDHNNNPVTFINNSGTTILVFYSIECSHCKMLLEDLNNNAAQLENIELFLLTREKYAFNRLSKRREALVNNSHVHFGYVDSRTAHEVYGIKRVPAIYIYRNGTLTNKIYNNIKVQYLLKKAMG